MVASVRAKNASLPHHRVRDHGPQDAEDRHGQRVPEECHEADPVPVRFRVAADGREGPGVVLPAELDMGIDLLARQDVPERPGSPFAEPAVDPLRDVPPPPGDGVHHDDGRRLRGKLLGPEVAERPRSFPREEPDHGAGLRHLEIHRHLHPRAAEGGIVGLRHEGDGERQGLLDRLERRAQQPDERDDERGREDDQECRHDHAGKRAAARHFRLRPHGGSATAARPSRSTGP